MPTSVPIHEAARLDSLRAYHILDTPSELAFDRIADLAAEILEMPMASVSFVDHDRQWLKAAVSIPVCETPREHSICAHAILEDDLLVVSDTLADARFVDNPVVTGQLGVRFYAGAPLRTAEGHALGALCVMDRRPRQFGARQRKILRGLAAMVIDELSLRTRREQLQEIHATIEERIGERTAELTRVNQTLRLSQQRFRQLFNQASDAAFVHDQNGRLIDVNDVACTSLGYTRAELLSLTVGAIDAVHRPEPGARFWRELAVGNVEKFESVHRRKDGSLFPVEIHVSVLETPKGRHLLALVRDITERKRSDELLRARVRQQEAVARLGTRALGKGGVDDLLDKAVKLVGENLGVDLCRIYQHLPAHGKFLVKASLQPQDRAVGTLVADDHIDSLGGYVLRTTQPAIVEDLKTEDRFAIPASLSALGVESALCVPIGGTDPSVLPYGLLGVGHRQRRAFTGDDMFFVQSVANVLAAAIERHRGEEALRTVETRYHRLAANTSGMVFQLVMQPDRTISMPFVSDGCRQLYELEPEEMQAEPRWLHWVVHPADKKHYRQTLRRSVEKSEPFHWEGRVLLRSGTVRWVTARSHLDPQPNGEVVWNGVVLDVSALKQAQHAMLAAKEEAERANNAKSEFLSRMSHELRTPLNAILGFGQVLELSPLSEQDGHCVQYILKGGRHLLSLVDEVLDLARAETGALSIHLVPLCFARLVRECVGITSKMAEARGVVCTVEDSPACQVPVQADEQRVRQVLLNLLSNAIKYNRQGGRVVVSCQKTPDGRIRCQVADTGEGISPDGLTRLFVPFERLGKELDDAAGTGLGLVVSKRLTEAMGGTLGVTSQVDVGSTFWIELPTAAPMNSRPTNEIDGRSPSAPVETASAQATVLYMEDNLSNLAVLTTVAQRLRPEWRLVTTTNGIKGLEMVREQQPDVVLLDLQMPGLAGDAVLTAIRADERFARLPVLLLSADATPQSRERLLALGANAYLTKPFIVSEVLAKIDDLLATVLRTAPRSNHA